MSTKAERLAELDRILEERGVDPRETKITGVRFSTSEVGMKVKRADGTHEVVVTPLSHTQVVFKPKEDTPSRPFRIAYVDIETAPNRGYTWGKYEQNVIAFEQEWYLLSFAVKWAGDSKPTVYALPDFPGYAENLTNDAQLAAKLWAVLDEADLVIAHNGDKFDVRKANARFLLHRMTPPSPYRTVDTLKLARKHFALNSNKLDDIAQALGVGRKAATGGFQLWLDCMAGDVKAWRKMKRYNAQDVVLLETVYERLRPWHATHPSIELGACATCGSDHLVRRGIGFSQGKRHQRWQCYDCGKWTKGEAA